MAYIAPNSEITLLKNVPLDNTYDHTVYFSSASQQHTWFNNYSYKSFTAQSYQRPNSGVLKLQCIADEVLDCNYLMFRNTRTSGGTTYNKWFYAFITAVDYVNEKCVAIHYQLDNLQTWFFEFELSECFIEREHSASDTIGDNLVPENLETGEYITLDKLDLFTGSYRWYIMTQGNVEISGRTASYSSNVTTSRINNTIVGCGFTNLTDAAVAAGTTEMVILDSLLADMTTQNKQDELMAIIASPIDIDGEYTSETVASRPNNIGGYSPRNNKLLTSPYNVLAVNAYGGVSNVYEYEYFSTPSTVRFGFFVDLLSGQANMLFYPLNYKNVTSAYSDGIVINNFATGTVNTDAFHSWLSRYSETLQLAKTNDMISGLTGVWGSAFSGGAAALAGNYAGAASGAFGIVSATKDAIFSKMAQDNAIAVAKKVPNKLHGSSANTLWQGLEKTGCEISRKQIRPEFARIIDDYFSMFGYATHRVKKPNRHVRQRWTYCKTLGCNAHGSLPADAMREICGIYDKGITFWDHNAEVGVYKSGNTWLSNNII